MTTLISLPDSPEAWALPSPCSEEQGDNGEKAEKKQPSPTEPTEETPSHTAFETPQLRQRRPPHSSPRIKKGEIHVAPLVNLQQGQEQPQPQLQHHYQQQQVEGLGASGRERKEGMGGADGEIGVLLWRPGGDNSESPSAAITAIPVAHTAATTATSSPINRSTSTPNISPKSGHMDSGKKADNPRTTDQPFCRSAEPLKAQVIYQQSASQPQYKCIKWGKLWSGAAEAIPKHPWLLLIKQRVLLQPSLVVAIPSLLLAAVPVSCILCVLAAALLPLCGFTPLVLGVYLLAGRLGDAVQGKDSPSTWLRIGAVGAALLLPLLLLPAVAFLAVTGLVLLLLLPLLCVLLPLGLLCFLPLAVLCTGLLLLVSLFTQREGRQKAMPLRVGKA